MYLIRFNTLITKIYPSLSIRVIFKLESNVIKRLRQPFITLVSCLRRKDFNSKYEDGRRNIRDIHIKLVYIRVN